MPSSKTPVKVALITGAGRRRLGRHIAIDLAAYGYDVAIHYNRSAKDANETVALARAEGGNPSAVRADLTDEQQIRSMFQWLEEAYGRLDVAVNTASVWTPSPLEQVSAADVVENFQVNTLGTFLCCQHAGLMMARQDSGGAIINFGDAAIASPPRDYSAYLVSKGAIPTLTRCMAVELAARNPKVRVNCIQPGSVMAPPQCTEPELQRRRDATLVKDADCPDTVTHTVRFLIENRFLTGACIPLDGGRGIATRQ